MTFDTTRPIMTVIAANTAGANCGICGAKVCPCTARGVTELSRMVNDPPPERAILTDLIAELRAIYMGGWPGTAGTPFDQEKGMRFMLAADRAEARLREVQS